MDLCTDQARRRTSRGVHDARQQSSPLSIDFPCIFPGCSVPYTSDPRYINREDTIMAQDKFESNVDSEITSHLNIQNFTNIDFGVT